MSPGSGSKRNFTWSFYESKSPYWKGVYGSVTAYFGCVETQARGALHFHVVIFGGLSPALLEEAKGFGDICQVISKALDTMYTAELPRGKYVEYALLKENASFNNGMIKKITKEHVYPIMKHTPNPDSTIEWKKYMWENVLKTGIHDHSFTCHKPPGGNNRCRGAFPQNLKEKTGPTHLMVKTFVTEEGENIPLSEIIPRY